MYDLLPALILPVAKVVWGLFTSHGTFNGILMLVNVFLSLKITLPKTPSLKITLPKTLQLKTLDFLQQTITMNENNNTRVANKVIDATRKKKKYRTIRLVDFFFK
jgi:hypothetical protein